MNDKIEEKTSNNLIKFKKIIENYQKGDYGQRPLTLAEILACANEEDLISKLTIEDLRYLSNHSTGMLRASLLNLVQKKELEDKPIRCLAK